jgi:hypothetical protein
MELMYARFRKLVRQLDDRACKWRSGSPDQNARAAAKWSILNRLTLTTQIWTVGGGEIVANLKNEKHEEYARYAAHCLSIVRIVKRSRLARHSTRNGSRVAETGRCRSAPFKTQANANEVKRGVSNPAWPLNPLSPPVPFRFSG